MKHIKQKHDTSCGVAAFAMVMNISYRKAMKILHPKRFWWFSYAGTNITGLQAGFKQLGYDVDVVIDKFDFRTLGTRAILVVNSVNVKSDPHVKHAVVWNPLTKSILDPATDIGFVSKYSIEYCLDNLIAAIVIV